jgi:histone H2A
MADLQIQTATVTQLNSLMGVVLDKIVDESNRLVARCAQKTLGANDIKSAVRSAFPGELAKHAVRTGRDAVAKFNTNASAGRGARALKETRAGLTFPVTRIETAMMMRSTLGRKTATAAVFAAAVLQYIAEEILELAGNATRDEKRKQITPNAIMRAIKNDEELGGLFRSTVLSGGVVPNIHARAIPGRR